MIEIELTPGERIVAQWAIDRLLEDTPYWRGAAQHIPIIGADTDIKAGVLAFHTRNSALRQGFHTVLINYPEITNDRDWGSTHCSTLWKKIEDATQIEEQAHQRYMWSLDRTNTQTTFSVPRSYIDPDTWAYERWTYWQQRAADHPGGVRRMRCLARTRHYRQLHRALTDQKNLETWLVDFWLLKGEHYTFVYDVVNDQMENVNDAADFLRQYVEEHLLSDEHTLSADLALHALTDVDWHAIASGLQEN